MIQGMNIQNESVEFDDKDDDNKALSLGNTQWRRATGETSDCDIGTIRHWAESNKDYLIFGLTRSFPFSNLLNCFSL